MKRFKKSKIVKNTNEILSISDFVALLKHLREQARKVGLTKKDLKEAIINARKK